MSEPSDAVLAYWSEHRQQLRQSETQRAMLTNYLLVITAGLAGLIAQQQFATRTLPLSILVVVLGLYGAVSAAKYHERAEYHLTQARALTATLRDLGALTGDERLDEYRQRHYRRYPRLRRVRLHWLWTGLHLIIAAFGIALAVVTIIR